MIFFEYISSEEHVLSPSIPSNMFEEHGSISIWLFESKLKLNSCLPPQVVLQVAWVDVDAMCSPRQCCD